MAAPRSSATSAPSVPLSSVRNTTFSSGTRPARKRSGSSVVRRPISGSFATSRSGGAESNLVMVALSGGGKRSAAFAFGVLRGMRDIHLRAEGKDSTLLDEIDLRDVKDVNLSLARPHVLIHIGSTDFRKRFEMALTIMQAARSGDAEALRRMRTPEQKIEQLMQNANNFSFIDTARSDRIVVNFASPGVDKAPVKQETKPTQATKR